MSRRVVAVVVGLGLGVALAGCGRQGDLDRPGPLWGAKAKADWAAAHQPAANSAPASNGIPSLPADATQDNAVPSGSPPPP